VSRSWSLTVPRAGDWLNANTRRRPKQLAPVIRDWRDAAHWAARAERLPKIRKAQIIATLHFADRRRRDPHNYYPTLKAIVDGLVDHGLLPDDSHQYLIGPDIRMGEPGVPRVQLYIREIV
jgi:Holliday junction resolvase RusA-like endonuclease